MNAQRAGNLEQGPIRAGAPRRWDPSYAAVAVTLIGGTVYVFFRLAYASFYASLHTTPEEVGLSYSQTLVRGVIPSISLATVTFLIASLLIFILITTIGYLIFGANLFRMYLGASRSLKDLRAKTRQDLHGSPSVEQYQDLWRKEWIQWKRQFPSTTRIMTGTAGMSDDEFIARAAAQDAGTETNRFRPKLSPFLRHLTGEMWRIYWRILLRRTTWLVLLILTLVALTLLIRYEASRVRDGYPIGPTLAIMTGLRAEQVKITALETGKNLPTELVSKTVIYLGESGGTAVIFIPEQSSTTVRVPLNDVVIESKE
jgi:hypothetical protein